MQRTANAAAETTVLAFGDSLFAGWGLAPGQSVPDQLQQIADAQGLPVRMINAGVSGDTSAGGLRRLGWALSPLPDVVMVELGANDALQGLSPEEMERNLEAILQQLQQESIPVLLIGMRAPANLGEEYSRRYNAIFAVLAERYNTLYYPFMLEGVAGNEELVLPDGLHPNAAGARVIAENLYPYLHKLVKKAQQEQKD